MTPGRRVTLDTCVLISYIISKKDGSVVKKVVNKAKEDDELMITDIIRDELLKYPEKKGSRIGKKDIEDALKRLDVPIMVVGPPPSLEELVERYSIRDVADLPILYSVDLSRSTILVTYDDDFFDGSVQGVEVEIMDPLAYLREDDICSGRFVPKNGKTGRIVKSRRS